MKTKLIATAIGTMALSQIVGAQSVFTSIPGVDVLGNSMAGDVQVVAVSADTSSASDVLSQDTTVSSDDSSFVSMSDNNDSDTTAPQSLAMMDDSQQPAPALVARNSSVTTKSKWYANTSSDLAADGGWLNIGTISAPDLSAVDTTTVTLPSVAASDDVAAAPENGLAASSGVEVAAISPQVAIPEPSAFGLLMLGGSALLGFFRRK